MITGELASDAAVLALPVRVRELQQPGRPTVAHAWVLTSAVRDGTRARLRVRQLAVGGVGANSDDVPVVGVDVRRVGARAAAERHRLQQHAEELAARHRPLGGWRQAFDRPAIHADTPDGFVPACPW
ncbi:hypothetical protein [Egicoccus halophilus]|uniref:Uncharacterized protein n=1 Tax=Egicoccus halophilus TaxID=1670830 RepID=A0A8J3AB27_9ACTN|nr:hypothetical protein [Egicoccus halophilus]GGI07021.1 hypothetical protein GCM10011354_22010 [Egicoccus halophilus]